jgi:thiol:disulfide interchange protein
MTANPERPMGFIVLAIALWFLSVAGAGAVFVFSEGSALLIVAFSAYAASAFAAGYGLWRRERWAPTLFAVWAAIVLVNGILFDVLFNAGPSMRGVVFVATFGPVLWWGHWYVRTRMSVGV